MDRDKFKDQAHELRNMMDQINENSEENRTDNQKDKDEQKNTSDGVNVLNLPPRSKVHEDKKTGIKWKISFPLVRLLVVLFILIVILVLTYQLWGKDMIESPITEQPFNKHPAGDMVKILPNQ